MTTTTFSKTQELLEFAEVSLNAAQNQDWIGDNSLATLTLQDAQTRALIAIAQELRRFNDLVASDIYEGN